MKKELYTAEQIYKYFGGSHYEMQRENILVEYKKYVISKRQEMIWLRELQDETLLLLKKNEDTNADNRFLIGAFVRLINLDDIYQKEKMKEAMQYEMIILSQEFEGGDLLYYFRIFESSLKELEGKWGEVNFSDLGITEKIVRKILGKIVSFYNNKDGWTEKYWMSSLCTSIYSWRYTIFLDMEDCCQIYRRVVLSQHFQK